MTMEDNDAQRPPLDTSSSASVAQQATAADGASNDDAPEDAAARGDMAVQRNGGSEGHANKSSADKKRDAAETAAEQKRVSELYMEEMSRDFGPVEEGDESFMRNFPTAFVSWETLESALQQYTESTCQVIRKHTTQTTANRNQATQKYLDGFRTPGTFLGSFYPDEMEWYKKVWVCSICRAFNVRARGFQASRSSGSAARRQQETEIKITAQLNPYKQDRDKFYIEVSWSGMHNHRCDEDAVLQFEREGSRIDDPAVLSIVREMRRHGKTPREIKRLVYECTGKEINGKEVNSLFDLIDEWNENGESSSEEDNRTNFPQQQHQEPCLGSRTISSSSHNTITLPERDLTVVQQNISRVAQELSAEQQASLANSLQIALFAWLAENRSPNAQSTNTSPAPMFLRDYSQQTRGAILSPAWDFETLAPGHVAAANQRKRQRQL